MSKSDDPIYLSPIPRSAADRKKKLGKGLGALMGETRKEEPLVAKGGSTGETVSRETSRRRGASRYSSTGHVRAQRPGSAVNQASVLPHQSTGPAL